MARKPVTIAELESATRMVHCMYGGVIRLNNIWRVLERCGVAPSWGWRICADDCEARRRGTFGTGTAVHYSQANLEEGLRLVQEQIDRRRERNARDRAKREQRRHRLFAKID